MGVTAADNRLFVEAVLYRHRAGLPWRDLYKARHLIESVFAKLKQFRAIATRYDKTARNFLAGIHLAAIAIWLKRRHALAAQHPGAAGEGPVVPYALQRSCQA